MRLTSRGRVLVAGLGFLLILAALVAGMAIRPSGIHQPTPPGGQPSPQYAVADAASATAYPDTPGWSYPAQMTPVGTLCMETGGGKVLGPGITAAATAWNSSDLTVVAKASCVGYPRNRTLKFVAYYNTAVNARGYATECAVYDGGHYTWMVQRGVYTWVADTPTVRVNYAATAVKQCQFSAAVKTNMMSHESGHWLGLSHATGITVMTSAVGTTYQTATIYDIRRINTRY